MGCCNKQFDLGNLPQPTHFDYDQIIITGGEPLLYLEQVVGFIKAIRLVSTAKIIVYTAVVNPNDLFYLLKYVDGITLTLHTRKDWYKFKDNEFRRLFPPEIVGNKSLRLNIFKEANADISQISSVWKVKHDIEWIEDCPLPENEVLMKAY